MTKTYRVYNKCKYDIGVQLVNNQTVCITPNSFRLLTADDILYIESICSTVKVFSQKYLVIIDPDNGQEISLQEVGGYTEEDRPVHMNDDEIIAQLKQPAKKLEAWIATVDDAAELHGIYEVAKTMDLPASKLKLLTQYMPDKDFLAE